MTCRPGKIATPAKAPETPAIHPQTSHQIVIPFDASVNLAVTSGFFRLADASGQEVARAGAAMIPMRVASGQQAAIVKLVVIGSKK